MTRLIILIVLTAAAVGIALVLQRRRPDPPSAPSYRAPSQLDRNDFADPTAPILLVVFASTACNTCPSTWATVQEVAARYADLMAHQRIDVEVDPDLHQRYRIDGVPTTIIADPEGVVQNAFFGPIGADQLLDSLPPPPQG
ncbi:MAG: thioredoxin domain-containing protein [Actinomycetota bacterium]